MSNIATQGGVKWDRANRSVTDDEAAAALAKKHPKSTTPAPHFAQVLSGSPGSGAAPGANGPPTTGPTFGSGGPLSST